ncbi:unnamed protein product [Ectocarpus sp. 12 AP-2014]
MRQSWSRGGRDSIVWYRIKHYDTETCTKKSIVRVIECGTKAHTIKSTLVYYLHTKSYSRLLRVCRVKWRRCLSTLARGRGGSVPWFLHGGPLGRKAESVTSSYVHFGEASAALLSCGIRKGSNVGG